MEEEITLRDFVRAVWRSKWWLMLTVPVVMAATAYVSLQMPKIYRANAILVPPEVDQAWPTPDGLKTRFGAAAIGGAIKPGTTATDVIIGILKSRRLALAAIEKFDLRRVYPAQAWLKLPRLPWQEGDGEPKLSEILEALADRTDIRVTKEGLLSISVEDPDPKRAAAIVAFYLEELQRANMDLQTTYTRYLARVLDSPIVPDKKVKPRVTLNTLIAGAATVLVWTLAVLCRLSLAPSAARQAAVAAPQQSAVGS